MSLSCRRLNLLIFLFTFAMMLVALLYFQEYLGLLPCPLCVSQRIFVILSGLIALAGYLHNPGRLGVQVYSAGTIMSATIGLCVSLRQVWLQNLPEDQVPACGPTLDYLIDLLPMQEVLQAMFLGDGNCAEVHWSLLGLSIPGWTAVSFGSIIVAGLFQCFRKSGY